MLSLSKAFAMLLNLAKKTQPNIDTTAIENCSFCIAIDELPQDIAIRIENGQVVALDDTSLADVTISGQLKAVIAMMTDEQNGLDNDDLYIVGRISTARQFQRFLTSFSLDWQSFFAQFLPDNMANKAAQWVEQGIDVAQDSAEKINQRLKQYLLEEKQVFVKEEELNTFADTLSNFHQRLDALLARVDAHESKTPSNYLPSDTDNKGTS